MPAVNRVLARACIVAGLGFAAGCVAAPSPNPALAPLRVIARIDLENLCREGVSPPIAIQNPAPGTASYSVRFTNISVLIQTPKNSRSRRPPIHGAFPPARCPATKARARAISRPSASASR